MKNGEKNRTKTHAILIHIIDTIDVEFSSFRFTDKLSIIFLFNKDITPPPRVTFISTAPRGQKVTPQGYQ